MKEQIFNARFLNGISPDSVEDVFVDRCDTIARLLVGTSLQETINQIASGFMFANLTEEKPPSLAESKLRARGVGVRFGQALMEQHKDGQKLLTALENLEESAIALGGYSMHAWERPMGMKEGYTIGGTITTPEIGLGKGVVSEPALYLGLKTSAGRSMHHLFTLRNITIHPTTEL